MIPLRFVNGQWEVIQADGRSWAPVSAEIGTLLQSFTSVVQTQDGELWFTTADGKTTIPMSVLGALLNGETPPLVSPEQQTEANAAVLAAGAHPSGQAAEPDEQAARAAGYVGPWPIPDYAPDPLFPTLIKRGSGLALMKDWVNYAQDQGIQVGPAKTADTPPLRFKTQVDAQKEADATGGRVVRHGGYYWVEDAAQPSELSFNEQFDKLLLDGNYAGAQQLWDIREQITSNGGRMTRAQAAQFLTGDLFKAEEIPALLDALTGPQRPSAEGQAAPPPAAPQPAPPALPAAGATGGPPGPASIPPTAAPVASPPLAARPATNVFQAQPALSTLSPEQFDPNFAGSSPEAQAIIASDLARRQQSGGAATGAFSPFAGAAQQTQNYQGLSPEQFDPFFAGASPEAQTAIQAELGRQQSPAGAGDFNGLLAQIKRGAYGRGGRGTPLRQTPTNVATMAPGAQPLSFADAIARINQRRLQQQLLNRPSALTVFR